MFPINIITAHGELGPFDEIMAIVAFGVFVTMMALPPVMTWLRQRRDGNTTGQAADTQTADPTESTAAPDSPVPTPPQPEQPSEQPARPRRDHYRLD